MCFQKSFFLKYLNLLKLKAKIQIININILKQNY